LGALAGVTSNTYSAPSCLLWYSAFFIATSTSGRFGACGLPFRLEHQSNNRPHGSPHSAGFAICSPQGMGEPHDIAPWGSQHLSCVFSLDYTL
jgi:hypothetical protein